MQKGRGRGEKRRLKLNCCNLFVSFILVYVYVVEAAPSVDIARRLSATSIEMSWDPISDVVVTSYSVKYRAVERVAHSNLDDMSTIVETTSTSIIITHLDPRYEYAVSVATKTAAGVGNYSENVTVGCK